MARREDRLSAPRGLCAAALLLMAAACESVLGFEHGVLQDGACAADDAGDAGACATQAGAAASTAGTAAGGTLSEASDAGAGGMASVSSAAGTSESSSGGAAGSDSSDGRCQTSEDCPTPDPNCGARCELRDAQLTCVPFALDADGDLFASAACKAAPGDDCDDSRNDVNPLADEHCDGIDSDCDGLADIEEDHLPLAGFTGTLTEAEYAADVAWSEADQVFGLAWSAAGDRAPYFAPMTVSGTMLVAPVALDVIPLSIYSTPTLAINAGDETFAVAWNNIELYYRTVDGSGALGLPVTRVDDADGAFGAEAPALSWTEAGAWAAFWTDFRDNGVALYGRTLFPNGERGAESFFAEVGFSPSVATLQQRVAAAWSASAGHAELYEQNLDFVGALTVDDAVSPVVGSNGALFGVAWRVDKLRFVAFDADGTQVCDGATEAEGFVPLDVVATDGGFLLFGGSPNVQVIEVSSDCRFGTRVTIDAQRASFVHAASAGTRGTTVVWGAGGATRFRHFGAHFCD